MLEFFALACPNGRCVIREHIYIYIYNVIKKQRQEEEVGMRWTEGIASPSHSLYSSPLGYILNLAFWVSCAPIHKRGSLVIKSLP